MCTYVSDTKTSTSNITYAQVEVSAISNKVTHKRNSALHGWVGGIRGPTHDAADHHKEIKNSSKVLILSDLKISVTYQQQVKVSTTSHS